ncbi:hypothetical protein TPHA_0D00550 [Tetrapisispora phaffii CBS 4417]|uniref:DnaJ homolog 1, mitochondrial n=1 Tax=Tetrapisispora phaffii (strain ATCC 24235 / CBS 4417 / NBRC 1672 / NRRL Y-8282 / UCD 70-5) TaxID=1071381 RepID=G8BS78_TETPH|nr:hypothetical protein TPHA_0D00550 [Tetrapisispora phaffii CBS 4417]CCE62699.1 hypothetical protein TPHA_0D00550 [Tetrapisispora phaffii CBS 4417]
MLASKLVSRNFVKAGGFNGKRPLLYVNNYKRLLHTTKPLFNADETFKDPYKTLGVSRDASPSDIKRAYYKLAKKYHPDINKEPGADKTFHNLQNAYEILSDEKKKLQYDQYGSSAFDQNGNANGAGGFNPFGGGASASGFADFGGLNFEDLFGAAFGRSGFRNGGDAGGFNGRANIVREYQGDSIEIQHVVSFKDAVFGLNNVSLKYKSLDPCGTCHGSGLKNGEQHKRKTCSYCNGTGTQVHVKSGFQMASTCMHCHGEGTTIAREDTCSACDGDGVKINSKKSLNVNFPSGLSDGDVIRIPGEGSYPNIAVGENDKSIKLSRGDLLVRIRVKSDPKFFVKNKYDIWTIKEIPITTAALGGTVEIETVDGKNIRLKVISGTQHDQVTSIPNMGIPYRNGTGRGNMNVQYKIVIKKPQSNIERCLWEGLADVTNDKMAKRTIVNGSGSIMDQASTVGTSSENDLNSLKRIEKFIKDAFKKFKGDNK